MAVFVSVITPAFNAAAHLAATIESCLAQTHVELELLVVDDGSTDETAAIATRFAAADPRVRVFSIANGGQAAARNLAIASARGELFALLDSDDVWMPDYLERQLDTLSQHPSVDVVTANAINLGGDRDGSAFWPPSRELRPITLLDMITREDAVHIFAVFRRTVIDRVGGFDPAFCGNEDYHFWLRAAVHGSRFMADMSPRGYYRRRPDSVSADQRRMLLGIGRVLQDIKAQCRGDRQETQAINAQLRRFNRELILAEARACVVSGNAAGGVECLQRLHAEERGPALSLMLALARWWPPMLTGGYRAKRAIGGLRLRLGR